MTDVDRVKIKLNSEARSLFKKALKHESCDVPENIAKGAQNNFKDEMLIEDIFWLKYRLPNGKRIHELLEKCEIVLPKPKVVPRNPELEARIQKLKKQEEERMYREMTKNVDSTRMRVPEDSFASQVKEMDRQLIAVASLMVSVAAGFAFGFLGLQWIIGDLSVVVRVLCGLASAVVIAVAELYFFLKKLDEPPQFQPSSHNDRKNK